ncbi:SPOR domain-containing protein [Sphingomonas sp. DT-204]|uniref:SPOR domain-containing protein n=1 Tax=Sphingomonas sp. DT-204 TaxID=3396166 RepID=UPI003F1AF48C
MAIGAGLLLLATGQAAAQVQPQDAAAFQEPPGDGPRGSSQAKPGEVRYDEVGYAGLAELGGVSIASSTLPSGSYVEVTALDSGRTILAVVTGNGSPGRLALLSPGAASALGIAGERAPVRVRRVTPPPQDMALLSAGKAASGRSDAPKALLVPLRKRLGPPSGATAPIATASVPPAASPSPPTPSPRPAPPPKKVPARASTPAPRHVAGYYVQVAALSSRARANALASSIGGTVEPAGALFRVRLGPFPDAASAGRGRAAAVRQGYPDARIVRMN